MFLAVEEKKLYNLIIPAIALALVILPEVAMAFEWLKVFTNSQAVQFVRTIGSAVWVIWAFIEILGTVTSSGGIKLSDLLTKIFFLLFVLGLIVGYKNLVTLLESIATSANV